MYLDKNILAIRCSLHMTLYPCNSSCYMEYDGTFTKYAARSEYQSAFLRGHRLSLRSVISIAGLLYTTSCILLLT